MHFAAWLELPNDIDGCMDENPASCVWRNSSQPCMTYMDELYKQKLSMPVHSILLDDFGKQVKPLVPHYIDIYC